MELYQLYNAATLIFALFVGTEATALTGGLIVGASVWAALFLLQGFGLYKMAKNRGLKRKGLAFIPFANVWYIGKLAGDCNVFGQRMKRAGLYTMIAQIVSTLLCGVAIAMELYLYIVEGAPQYDDLGVFWINLTGFSATAEKIYAISGYVLPIFQLVYEILMLILLFGLYKKYYPKNYMFLGILSLFIPLSRFIVIFVLRNRKAIDYEAYMQARRDAYMRQQQQYYNTYGNPYGGYRSYGDPYNQNGYNQPQRPEPEDPFTEFGGKKEGADTNGPFDDFEGDKKPKEENPFDEF